MANLENIINKYNNVLIFTAHHDDEVLFTGGLIEYLFNKNINIYLLVSTNYKDENINYDTDTKYNNFLSIMEKYKINFTELNLPNISLSNKKSYDYKTTLNIIKNYFQNNKFDIIFTHNKNGEYGHPQHKLINKYIKFLKKSNIMNSTVFTFGNNKSSFFLKINLDVKHELIKMYSFKDNDKKQNVWYKQCIKSYNTWCSEEFEYFNIL